MALHKFALLGGKVPAATGMRAAGRPPKAGRRTSFAAAAAPPGRRPAGSPRKPCPHRAQLFSVYFLSEGVRFLRLMFFRRLCTFCGRDRTDSPSPERKAIGSFLSTLAACRFWGLQWGRIVPIPRKGKPMGHFYPPLPLADFGPLQWGRIVPIPPQGQGKRMGLLSLIARFCQLRGEVLPQQAAGQQPGRLRRQGGKVVPRGGRGGVPGQ